MRALIFDDSTPVRPWLAARTERACAEAGVPSAVLSAEALENGPVWLLRSGSWLVRPPSGPAAWQAAENLVGLGATDSPRWREIMAHCGGDFAKLRFWHRRRPLLVSVWLSADAASQLGRWLREKMPPAAALERLVWRSGRRAVHVADLDVAWDARCRIFQLVTTLQIGGAERVTVDLAAELSRAGTPTAVGYLGKTARRPLPAPGSLFDLTGAGRSSEDRAAAVHTAAVTWGADLIHAHLLSAADVQAIRARKWPLVVHVHNMEPGWPADFSTLRHDDADLLIACAHAVDSDLQRAGLPLPSRVVWNGIVPAAYAPTPARASAGVAWRARLAPDGKDRLLVCIANPRPQKRLPLLAQMFVQLTRRYPGTSWHLAIAGGPLAHPEIHAAQQTIEAAGLAAVVHWLDVVADTTGLIHAADVIVSLSAWEGLSLAHLEALAAGKSVVATAVGGTAEIAAAHPCLHLVAADAPVEEIADTVAEIVGSGAKSAPTFPPAFTRHAMASHCRALFFAALCLRGSRRGLCLIANNFSIGGAQSSARRLLLGLRDRGMHVRAMVIEEDPAQPTPGRQALTAAGIDVMAIPPPSILRVAEACEHILLALAGQPPEVVVFWNVIASYKVALADALWSVRLFDVSPGEMFHTSLERYFSTPREPWSCRSLVDYAQKLTGLVVKYGREADTVASAWGCPVSVIPNGIDIPPPPPRKPPAELRLMTAARLSPDKRLEDLLHALRLAQARLPAWRLDVFGGEERGHRGHARQLRRLGKGLPIFWHGAVPGWRERLGEADIFVMISEPAGCPNASLEALAAGVPVVATDHGGASEQVIDGVTGRLVPNRDPAALADAIVALANDPELRRRLGAAGRRHVETALSNQKFIDSYWRLFQAATMV